MDDLDSEWRRKGATLSQKTAQEEFGLTWEAIVRAIRAGKLQYREGSMYGNPWLRLLRREVEALVSKNHGENYLKDRQTKTELARIKPRVEAAENPDCPVGRAEIGTDRQHRKVMAVDLTPPRRTARPVRGAAPAPPHRHRHATRAHVSSSPPPAIRRRRAFRRSP